MKKIKYTPELKAKACEMYSSGEYSTREICEILGIHYNQKAYTSKISDWMYVYREAGPDGFKECDQRKNYTDELKATVVKEYLDGKSNALEIATKYRLSSYNLLMNWVKMYNTYGICEKPKKGQLSMGKLYKSSKADNQASNEINNLEKLKEENKRLKQELEDRDMLIELLKKVKEFEGR